jgi:hypothetical protein
MQKSQSALEFLVTYGWAFLVILIAVGVLSSMGTLSIANFMPDLCYAGGFFSCVEETADADENSFIMQLANGLSDDVRILRVSSVLSGTSMCRSNTDVAAFVTPTGTHLVVPNSLDYVMPAGSQAEVVIVCPLIAMASIEDAEMARIEFEIEYQVSSQTYSKTTSGYILVKT